MAAIGYGTIVRESIRFASGMRSFWICGAFVLYLQAGYVFFFEETIFPEAENVELSGLLLFGLLLPGVTVALMALHAAADSALIAGGLDAATGKHASLGTAVRRGRASAGRALACWLILAIVLVAWAGLTSGLPVLLGILLHPLVGIGFGMLGGALFLITCLFLYPLGFFALRSLVVDDASIVEAWQHALGLVREQPARSAGLAITGALFTLLVSSIEVLAVVASSALWLAAKSLLPTPLAVGVTVLVLGPIYVGVRGWLGSSLSYYWTLSYLWVRQEADVALTDT